MADSSLLIQPVKGKLAAEVERLTNLLVNEISSLDAISVDDYLLMASTDPIVGAAIEVPMLLGSKMLGEYTHPESEKQDFIRANFAQMHGSLKLSFCEMWQAKWVGHSFSELSYNTGSQWTLESIYGVDPRYFRYAGSVGKIETVKYRSTYRGLIDIPYTKGIHIVNGRHLNLGRDPYGFSESKKAYSYWQAKRLILAAMVIAAQRQATPIILGQTDIQGSSNLVDALGNELENEFGEPIFIRNSDRMKNALELLENQSVLVLDIADKITAIDQQTDGAFFLNVLRFLNSQIMISYLMPETILSTGSQGASGDSNLNAGHMSILNLSVSAMTDQIKERLIEDPVRNLLDWNYGPQTDYGSFPEPAIDKTDNVALLGVLANASNTGVLGGNDLAVINRARDLAGVEPIDQILIQQAKRYSGGEL